MGIRPNTLRAVEDLGFVNPMPIQEKVIPFLLADKHADIIGLAQIFGCRDCDIQLAPPSVVRSIVS